jgi:PAS domain S-box-containing protein
MRASGGQWWLSVRVRLVAFALLCAVPLLVLTALRIVQDRRHVEQHAADSAEAVADRLAMEVGLVLGAAESVAHAIGGLELTSGTRSTSCSVALERATAASGPLLLNFTLSSPAGHVLCSAQVASAPVYVGDRSYFQQAVALRRPVLSGLTLGRVVGRQVLLLAVPILAADGQVTSVATAVINPDPLTRGLSRLGAATVVALLDRHGVLASRFPSSPAVPVGSAWFGHPLVQFARAGGGAGAQMAGLDGVPRLYASRPIQYRGEPVLWAVAGVDAAALEELSRVGRLRELGLVLLVAAAVVALAVMAMRPLVLARVRNLLGVAAQVAQGNHASRVPVGVRDELTPVESAFNGMLDALAADRAVLEASESRYRMLFEHSLDGVLQMDSDGLIVAANPAACRILGRTEAQLKGVHRSRLTDPDDPRVDELLRQRQEAGQARGELTLLRGDGSRIEVEVAARAYRDGQGRWQACIVIHDVTEQKAMQQRVLRLNRELEGRVAQRTEQLQVANRELEAFAYSVSHDLRAPVAVIRSFAEVLDEKEAVQGDKNRHYLRRIRAAGLHMNELIDGLLALAQISRSQLEWTVVDLSALAREAAQEQVELQPRPVQVDVAPGLHAMGDARLLRVVLHNLMSNAIKFSSRKAQPRVSFEVAVSASGEQAFCVRDNGEGFDPAQAHRLFVAFQRLHRTDEYPGVGIGLATVQRIVQRHGGRIWAEARPGAGAAFYFVLGARDGAGAAARAQAGINPAR